ncbi:MAG: hypothetical protein ABEJ85_01330 [Haloarculaceae archaeon]
MRRRRFLQSASLVGLALAGCIGSVSEQAAQAVAESPTASLRMTEISPAEIPAQIHGTLGGEGGTERASVIQAVSAGESVAIEGTRPPLEDGETAVYEGTLYRISMTVTGRTPAATYPILLNDLSYEGVTRAPDDERVEFSALPAVDRAVFRRNGLAEGELLGIGTSLVYTDAQAERSALVSPAQSTIIVWSDGTRGRFSLRGEPRDTPLKTYEYRGEVVEPSTAAYGKRLREEHAITLSNVSDAQADILDVATGEEATYTVAPETTPSPAFTALADRIREGRDLDTLPDDGTTPENEGSNIGTYLVVYERTLYWTDLWLPERQTTTPE